MCMINSIPHMDEDGLVEPTTLALVGKLGSLYTLQEVVFISPPVFMKCSIRQDFLPKSCPLDKEADFSCWLFMSFSRSSLKRKIT